MRYFTKSVFVLFVILLVSCASTKKDEAVSVQPTVALPDTTLANALAEDSLPVGNKDIAHESFLRYLYLQLREEPELAVVFLQHAAESDPANRYLAFTLAEELAERERYDAALEIAEKAKKLPGKSNAAEDGLLATLYVRTGAADSAKAYYKKTIAKNEEDYTKIYEYSLFLEWEEPKDNDELIRVYRLLLPRLHYMRNMFNRTAQLLLQTKNDSAFCDLLSEAFQATGDKTFMLDKYNYYDGMNMRDSAIATLATLNKAIPEDTTVLKLYGAALITMNRSSETSALISEYAKEHEMFPSLVFLRGLAARGEKQPDNASKYFNSILNDSLFGHQAHAQLSFIAAEKQDTINAIKEIEMADSLAPGQYFTDRLRSYVNYNQYGKAFPMLEQMLDTLYREMQEEKSRPAADSSEKKPAAKERYFALLSVYADMNARYANRIFFAEPDSAIVHYKKSLEAIDLYLLNDPAAFNIKFLKASVLERCKKTDEAVAVFRELLKQDPKDHLVMNYLGYTLIDLARTPEEVQEGIALVDSALALDPENVSYLDSKAWGLYRTGKNKEALDIMIALSTKQPEILQDVSYWEHMGRILEALGEKEKAMDCFDKLYELSPKHPFAKKK